MKQEGAFQGTHSRVAISHNYEQPSSSTGDISPELLRHFFQWSDDKEESSGYASSTTISSARTGFVSVNMIDNDNEADLCHRMEAQKQTSEAQQEALKNFQRMLTQLMIDQNNEENSDNNEWEEENKTPENKNTKESSLSLINAEVIKGIRAQVASLAQRDELKKVGMTCPYPLE